MQRGKSLEGFDVQDADEDEDEDDDDDEMEEVCEFSIFILVSLDSHTQSMHGDVNSLIDSPTSSLSSLTAASSSCVHTKGEKQSNLRLRCQHPTQDIEMRSQTRDV